MTQLPRLVAAVIAVAAIGAGGAAHADTTTTTTTSVVDSAGETPTVEATEVDIDVAVTITDNETFPEPGIYRGHERWRLTIGGADTVPLGTTYTLSIDVDGGYWATHAGHFIEPDEDVDPDTFTIVDCGTGGTPENPNDDLTCTITAGTGTGVDIAIEVEAHILPADRAPAGPLTFTATVTVDGDTNPTNNAATGEPRPLTGRDIDDWATETSFDGCLDIEDPCADNIFTGCGWNLQLTCIPAIGGDDPTATTAAPTTVAPAGPTVPPSGQLPDTGTSTAVTALIAAALLASGLGFRHLAQR